MKLRINWKARAKNVLFIIAVVAAVLTAVGVSLETLTSWQLLWQAIMELLSNPFRLSMAVITICGIVMDPTTVGLGDSKRALGYQKPLKE